MGELASSHLNDFLLNALKERKAANLHRTRAIVDSPQSPQILHNQQWLKNFSSNDYLSLSNHPRVIAALQKGAALAGCGAGASHLVTGHHRFHHALEEQLAAITGREKALLFSTGFSANVGTIAALMSRGDEVFEDRLNHASLLDGALMSGAKLRRFAHNDCAQLEHLLTQSSAVHKLIAVDGVFSMDGDAAPLSKIAKIAKAHKSWLMVDDAHGFGWLGNSGAGSCETLGLTQDDVPILMGTLGKAVGSYGAFIAGSEALIDYLVQFARPYVFSTAMPPAVAFATSEALRVISDEPWHRQTLVEHIAFFRQEAAARNLPFMPSNTPIQPLVVGDAQHAVKLSRMLADRGFLTIPIRPPTVPIGASRLRITLTAAHTQQDIRQLLDALGDAYSALMLPATEESIGE